MGDWPYIYKWRFHSCSTFPNCCVADQEKAACSPITLPDYRLMARQKHNCLPNSPVVEAPSPSKRDTEARFQAHLARYRTHNTKGAVAAAEKNGTKAKDKDKKQKRRRGRFFTRAIPQWCLHVVYVGIMTTLTKSVVFRCWIATNHGESLACRCDLSPQLRPGATAASTKQV